MSNSTESGVARWSYTAGGNAVGLGISYVFSSAVQNVMEHYYSLLGVFSIDATLLWIEWAMGEWWTIRAIARSY